MKPNFITDSVHQLTPRLSRIMMATLILACASAVYAQKAYIKTVKGVSGKTATNTGSARISSPLNTQTTFGCQDGVSYRLQGDNSTLYQVNLRTGAATLLLTAAQLNNRDLTALGYNPLDNFMYASISGTNDIVQIGITGEHNLYDIPGLPVDTYEAGDVSPNGILYLYSSGSSTIRKVTLSDKSVSSIALDAGSNLQDISISPDGLSIYGIDTNSGDLVRYAITGGARTTTSVGMSSGSTSTFIDETGNLYVVKDATSSVFEIVGPGIPKAESATQLNSSSTAIINTDGARCIKSSATTQTPFVCTASQAFAVVGQQGYASDKCTDAGNSKLAEYSLQNGTLVSETGQLINSFNSRTTLNNMGYNVKDNYLWAYRNGTNQLVRIGSEKTVDFFAISGLSNDCTYGTGTNNTVFTAGDINTSGVLYLLNSFNGDRFIRVDLNPSSGTYLQKLSDIVLSGDDPTSSQNGVDDFGFNPIDGNLYGVDGNDHLFRITPAGVVKDLGSVSGLAGANGYLSAFFDNNGTLYVQPGSSNDTYRILNVAGGGKAGSLFINNGASLGSNGDGARCPTSPVVSYAISGTVFNDANGLLGTPVNTVDGTAVSSLAGNTFSVNLVAANKVVATTTLTNGNFSFTGVSGTTTYSVVLSKTPGVVGSAPPSTTLTGNVVNTGEHIGDGAGSDGTPDGVISVAVGTSSVADVNFGVDRLPTADPKTAASQANPGGTNKVTVPTLTGSDPEDGTYDGTLADKNTIVIKSLPTSGTLVYNNIAVTLDQVITNYDPSKLMVDPADGPVSVTFTYAERDAAGKDSSPALVTIPFTGGSSVTISGTVFNDANGLVDGLVNGTAVSGLAGNTFSANLVGSNGKVIATTLLTNGVYSFANVTPNASYSVVLSNTPGTVTNNPPGTTLTGNVVNTGENIGTAVNYNGDGNANGVLPISVTTSNVTNANFGVDRLPTADPKTAASQGNPGNSRKVVVPTLTGSDPEDGTYDGTVADKNTIVIKSLPTNGKLYYDGQYITTVDKVITNYDPNNLTLDPDDGPISVTFTYSERDAAGKDSPPALVTIPFKIVPDLTPTIYAQPSTLYGKTDITVVVDVDELNSVATSGLITVYVTKDIKTSLIFPPGATMINNKKVKNSSWTYNGTNPSFHILTTTDVIPSEGRLSFGFTGVLNPSATSGTLTFSTTILAPNGVGSGGEVNLTNNTDAEKIDYFQQ